MTLKLRQPLSDAHPQQPESLRLFHNEMDAKKPTDAGNVETGMPADLSSFNTADLIKTPHNSRLYQENQNLKKHVNDLIDYQLAHPRNPKPVTREEIDNDKKVKLEIHKREKLIRSQLSVIKTLYRQSVLKVREEKAKTADDRAVNDALILGLHNLKYEEQSLRSEIAAAENYEWVLP